jgi:hypothetical protein
MNILNMVSYIRVPQNAGTILSPSVLLNLPIAKYFHESTYYQLTLLW